MLLFIAYFIFFVEYCNFRFCISLFGKYGVLIVLEIGKSFVSN